MDGERVRDMLPLRALFYGEGVFETFRFRSAMPEFFDKHIKRMKNGAELLGIPVPDGEHIANRVLSAISESGISDAYVKVCVLSEGSTVFYGHAEKANLLVIVRTYAVSRGPINTSICSFKRNSDSPLLRIKSLNYLENILARREAIPLGYDESLLLNEYDEIAEGSASNIFWVRDGVLFTPLLACGVLPGIIRGILIEHASETGLDVQEGRYHIQDIMESEFAFFTNSLTGLLGIARINETPLSVDSTLRDTIKGILFNLLKWG